MARHGWGDPTARNGHRTGHLARRGRQWRGRGATGTRCSHRGCAEKAACAQGAGEEGARGRHRNAVVNAPVDELEDSRAPLLDHLIELRRRLLFSLLALVAALCVCLYFDEPIFGVLVRPLVKAGQSKLIYTQLFEAFFVQLKVAFFAGMMIAFPVIANQLWQFVAPGLYRKEKKALLH